MGNEQVKELDIFQAIGWKFRVGDRVGCKTNPAMTGIVVTRVAGQSLGNTERLFRDYHVRFDITSAVPLKEEELVRVDKRSWPLKEDRAEPTGEGS